MKHELVTASLIIRSETHNEPPNPEHMKKAAAYIQNLGFDVIHVGFFNIMVKAPLEALANELLGKVVESIEVAPPATSLKQTPAKGDIDFPPPRANTQAEVQESWHRAKNYPTPIAPKKDPL